MTLEDRTFLEIPHTSLEVATVHGTSGGMIFIDDRGRTFGLGEEGAEYVSTLKEGDQIILATHGGKVFVYGPLEGDRFYSGKQVW